MRRTAALPWLRTLIRAGAPTGLLLLLAGCMLPPEPRTTAARDVFNLYTAIFLMGLAVFIAVEGFIVYAVFRYRRKDDRLPDQTHGNTLVEIIWTAIPTVIVLVLFVISVITLGTVEARTERPGVTIEVQGFQWQWTFRYLDGDEDPENDYSVTGAPGNPPVMGVPVGESVRLILRTDDVIHSFFVPHFLIKRDVVPVRNPEDANTLEFTVTEAGTYSGQCAEFCGDLHADMTLSVQAMSRAEFDQWLADGIAGATPQPSVEPGGEVVELSADQIEFDQKELSVPGGTPFTLRFANLEALIHNVSITRGDETIFTGDGITGPDATIDYPVAGLEPGEYEYICIYHPIPEMTGTLTVE